MLRSVFAAEIVGAVKPSYRDVHSEIGNKILTDLDERAVQDKAEAKADAYIKPTMVKRAVVDFFVKSAADPYKDVTSSKQQANVERARIAEYKARKDFKAAEVRLKTLDNDIRNLKNLEKSGNKDSVHRYKNMTSSQFEEQRARAQTMHEAMKNRAVVAKEKLTQDKVILKQFNVVAGLEKDLNTALTLESQRATVEQARVADHNAQQRLSVAEERLRNVVENPASGEERMAAQKERDDLKKQADATRETFTKETKVVARLTKDLQGAESDPKKILNSLGEASSKREALITSGRALDQKAKSASVEVKKLQQADKKIQNIDKQIAKLEQEKRALQKTDMGDLEKVKAADQRKILDDKIAQLKENKILEEKVFKPKVPARPSRPVTSSKGPAPAIPARPTSMQKPVVVKPVDEEVLKRRLDEKQKIHDDAQEQKAKSTARLEEINKKMKDPKLNPMDRVDLGIEKSRLTKEIPVLDEKLQAAKADLDNVQKEAVELERVRQLDEEQKSKNSKPAQVDVQEKNMLGKLIDDPIPSKKELRPAEHMTEERKTRILENYKKKQALERPVAVQTKDLLIDEQDSKAKKIVNKNLSIAGDRMLTPAETIAKAREREAEREQKVIAAQKIAEEKKQKAEKKIVNKVIKKVKAIVKKPALNKKPTTARVMVH